MTRRSDSTTMLAGWLFADLILAFAVIVLGSDAGDPARADAAAKRSTTTSVTTTQKPRPATTLAPRPKGLSTSPVCLFAQVGPSSTPDDAASQFRFSPAAGSLGSRRAGLVLVWEIRRGGPSSALAKQVIDGGALGRFAPAVFGARTGYQPPQLRPYWSSGAVTPCPFPSGVQTNIVAEVYLLT